MKGRWKKARSNIRHLFSFLRSFTVFYVHQSVFYLLVMFPAPEGTEERAGSNGGSLGCRGIWKGFHGAEGVGREVVRGGQRVNIINGGLRVGSRLFTCHISWLDSFTLVIPIFFILGLECRSVYKIHQIPCFLCILCDWTAFILLL